MSIMSCTWVIDLKRGPSPIYPILDDYEGSLEKLRCCHFWIRARGLATLSSPCLTCPHPFLTPPHSVFSHSPSVLFSTSHSLPCSVFIFVKFTRCGHCSHVNHGPWAHTLTAVKMEGCTTLIAFPFFLVHIFSLAVFVACMSSAKLELFYIDQKSRWWFDCSVSCRLVYTDLHYASETHFQRERAKGDRGRIQPG